MPQKSDTHGLPKNWPSHTPYLTTQSFSPTLDQAVAASLRTRPKDAQDITAAKGPCALVKITPISTPTHPACGQAGLFAVRDLKPGTFILQYLGVVHAPSTAAPEKRDLHAESNYDLSLDRELGACIDADAMGNEARFINDYRGIGNRPNAEFKEIWDPRKRERGMGVWVLGEGKSGKGKAIRKGEEILVSYGRGFWDGRKSAEGTPVGS
ncbi:SET domain-containing protein [Calycina marina]|uniref:SET domain-containing protein n=1 Tax=Calycina marina TaxID=1763456 RepID=A0A9P7Z7S0_9HELO|nr:SET domain-containing protein [Calycina marina]